jgi:hypothetical protein
MREDIVADPASNERQILKAALSRTSQCLPVEILAAIAEEPMDARTNLQAREHLGRCAHCQNELALFREFQEAEARPGEVESVAWVQSELQRRSAELAGRGTEPAREPESLWARITSRMHWRTLSLVAASLLVVVAAGVYLRSGAVPDQRGEPVIYRSQNLSAVAPTGEISAVPANIQWQSAPGAAKYQVRLMEVDRTAIWSAETGNTSISIPPAVRERMTPGRAFLWDVTAWNAAGERIAAANLQNFHILATTR